jgi:Uma2 family endonuclease
MEGTAQIVPLTLEQYHGMIDEGLLARSAPVELIGGFLIRKDSSATAQDDASAADLHTDVIRRIEKLSPAIESLGGQIRSQLPIAIPPSSEPEPDISIVRAEAADAANLAAHQYPGPADVLCVIEVADNSLRFDQTTKLETYAAAGIPCYAIVDLVHNQIEVHSQPIIDQKIFSRREKFTRGQNLWLPMGNGTTLDVPVEKILPRK